MQQTAMLRTTFWIVLVTFLAWDFFSSQPIDLRYEAPLIAAGSGVASHGGHCAMPD